jgi:CNT family concentrative nucleoside transporter
LTENLQSILGLAVIVASCALFSSKRSAISPWLVVKSVALQFVLALMLLKLPASQHLFWFLNQGIEVLQAATLAGTSFIFGFIGGGPLPYAETVQNGSMVLAFQTLPMIIVISVLSGLLIYWRMLPVILRLMSLLLEKTLRIGGAAGLAIVANAFLGMVDPLLIKPYLSTQKQRNFAVMIAGMDHHRSMISRGGHHQRGSQRGRSPVVPPDYLPGVVYISHLLMPNTGRSRMTAPLIAAAAA